MKRYVKASFNTGTIPDWLKKDKSAIAALNRAGIDLANCTFSKERTGKVGDNYTIYLVKGTKDFDSYKPFVWIPGLYNDDDYVNFKNYSKRGWIEEQNRYGYGGRDSKAIKYFPKKDLNIIDTVYVYKATNKKPYKKDRYVDPRYDEYGNYLGQQMIPGDWHYDENDERVSEPGHWSKQGAYYGKFSKSPTESNTRDKSGYKIPDPKDRLKKFYESPEGMNKRIKLIRSKLDNVYMQLENAKEDVFNAILPQGSRDDYRKFSTLYNNLDNAIACYEAVLEKLEKLERHSGQGSLSRWPDGSDIDYALRDLDRVQEYIDTINRTLDANG